MAEGKKGPPMPINRLNKGPPKQPAKAIPGLPALDTAKSVIKSALEFPHASTERPKMLAGTPEAMPNKLLQFRRLSYTPKLCKQQKQPSQATLCTKFERVVLICV
eukprot:CAMPEP_0171464704 /NCGR_PEP_ID=MMETSP0945-20130129/7947_1 /TAXON_ID=109269 /ORGANISM="Vaucheria litorea, Strain CCMP2940" /LENGTH=104 /DNA_ID=CAMNT_0011991907 /DNA_START=157 /DNA_END=471 /DNA_ORIENTATION=-